MLPLDGARECRTGKEQAQWVLQTNGLCVKQPGDTPFSGPASSVLCRLDQGLYFSLKKEKSPDWTAGKYIFKPTVSQLVLHGLKPYDWTNSCTLQSTFNKKRKSCCPLPPAALHFSAIEWEYFLPSCSNSHKIHWDSSCSNSHKIHSDFTEAEAYLSQWRKVCCIAWFINSKYPGNTLCKKHYNSKSPIILITFFSY